MTNKGGLRLFVSMAVALLLGVLIYVQVREAQPAVGQITATDARSSSSAASDFDKLPQGSEPVPLASSRAFGGGDSRSVLDDSKDFDSLRLQLEDRARAGDALARRHLAMAYEYCAQYRVRGGYAQNIEHLANAASDERAASQIRSVGRVVTERCQGFLLGQDISVEKIRALWVSADAKGDPVARLRVIASDLVRGERPSSPSVADAVVAAARSRDPQALLAVADFVGLSRGLGLPLPSELPDVAMAPEAWRIAACRRAASTLCDASSILLSDQCVTNARCGFISYEDLVRRGEIPLAAHAELDRSVSAIENFLNRRGAGL